MYEKSTALFLYNLTPLHAGAGEGQNGIDLPIQREAHTRYPKIEASGIKGALKESFKRNDNTIRIGEQEIKVNAQNDKGEYTHISIVFGPEEGDLHSSCIGFSDARLLLFPVPSLKGTFAWITCPHMLNQFLWDMQRISPEMKYQWEGLDDLQSNLSVGTAYVENNTQLKINTDTLFLQEYPIQCINNENTHLQLSFLQGKDRMQCTLGEWLKNNKIVGNTYFQDKLCRDIAVLSDDDFRDFVEMNTEVITRIRIDSKTGIVEDGALFTEEYLPAQSLLYASVAFAPVFLPNERKKSEVIQTADQVASFYRKGQQSYWQIGGNATLGKGTIQLQILNA